MSDPQADSRPEPLIHLVFKTHLDLGFTALAEQVRQRYHDEFIPHALDTAEYFDREDPNHPLFVWTTGAWLIWDHLRTQGADKARRLERAIERGLIRWHGLPYTLHSELMSRDLFAVGLTYSADLDRQFGTVTRAAKMTDVPGHTRGIVPVLAEAGITYLHLGVNEASPVPDVPPIFAWQAGSSRIAVQYEASYGGVSQLPDGRTGLAFAHAGDNLGPPAVPQVADAWRHLLHAHPGARMRASSLEPVAEILAGQMDDLPVVTREIGDSWIYGAGSDPQKLRRFLALQRLFARYVDEGLTPERRDFGRRLTLVPEHTWGLDIKSYLRDEKAWSRSDFEAARRTDPRFAMVESSWEEQSAYLGAARDALSPSDRAKADKVLSVDADPLQPDAASGSEIGVAGWRIGLGTEGTITSIESPDGARMDGTPLLALTYFSYDAADIDRHIRTYVTKDFLWALYDHGKPGLAQSPTARSTARRPTLTGLADTGLTLAFEADLVSEQGAPPRLDMRFVPTGDGALDIELRAWDKPVNRQPEAMVLSLTPAGTGAWQGEKLGLWVDLDDVVARAGHGLQAVGRLRAAALPGWEIEPLDTPLVAPAGKDFMDFADQPDFAQRGVDFNLFNTKWGTNFRMWIEGDLVARFRLHPPVR